MIKNSIALFVFVLGIWGNSFAQLTISGSFTAVNKVYDGTTTATFNQNNLSLNGVTNGDDVSIGSITISYDSKTVGNTKTVRVTAVTLSGADASGYTVNLTNSPTTTASITRKEVQISGSATISNKEYDGTTTATIVNSTTLTLLGKVGNDLISLSNLTAKFEDKSVGTGKAVTLLTASLTGNDAGNYTLIIPTSPIGLANITTKQLSIVGSFTVANKVYDGTTTATISDFSTLSLFGVLNSEDVVIISPKGVFSNKQAGNGKAVQLTEAYLSGSDAANYTVTVTGAPLSTANIEKKLLTVGGSLPISNRVYDGTTTATVSNISALTLVGRVTGDQVTVTQPTVVFNNKNVGTGKTVTLTSIVLAGTDATNYTFTLNNAPTGTATITAKSLTLTGSFAVDSKVYDGNRQSTIVTNSLQLDGVINGDDATISTTQALFDTSLPGSGKQVALSSVTLAGVDASNYSVNLSTAPKTTADINTKELSISGSFIVANKTYDGTVDATISNSSSLTLTGVVSGDQVSLSTIVAEFSTKTAGNAKTAILKSATLTGANADRYTLTLNGSPTTTAEITAKTVTLTGSFAVSSKTYDGSTTAAVTSFNLLQVNGVVNGDQVTLFQIVAAFENKKAGVGKVVNISSGTLTGSDAANYAVSTAGNATSIADISKKSITIGGSFTVNTKQYDAATTASINVNALSLVGTVANDVISFDTIQIDFVTATPGTGKQVNITSVALTGTDAVNYDLSLVGSPTALGSILRKTVTLTGSFTAANKVYDGTDNASITNQALLVLSGIVNNEDVTSIGLAAKFSSKDVGVNKVVSISNGALAGNDATNYTLDVTSAPTATASITKDTVTLTGTFTVDSKVYDGSKTASLLINSLQLNGVDGSDVVSVGTLSLLFDDALPGQNKTVRLQSVTLAGADASNYSVDLTGAPTSTAEIFKKELTITGSFTVNDKIYDGTLDAQIAVDSLLKLSGVIGSEVVKLSAVSAHFTTDVAGIAISVVIQSASLTGLNASNYQLSTASSPTAVANILTKELTVSGSFTVSDKVYDGTIQATISDDSQLVLNGIVNGDDVSLADIQAEFEDKHVGNLKSVNFINANLTGADFENYTLNTNNSPVASASITKKQSTLSGSFTAKNKSYDGTTQATIDTNNLQLSGILAGDDATINPLTLGLIFDTIMPGTGKLVTIQSASITGSDAENYTLNLGATPTTTASITKKGLKISGSFSVSDKLYDGTTTAIISDFTQLILDGVVGQEEVLITNPIAHFSDKLVGNDKLVSIQNATISGANVGNYELDLTNSPTSLASITEKTLSISGSFTVHDKVYDGSANAQFDQNSLILSGTLVGDDVSADSYSIQFADKNIGVNKPVTIQSVTLAGADASNYSVDLTGSSTSSATISPIALTILGSFTAADKDYDASKKAHITDSLSLSLNGILTGEIVKLSTIHALFSDSLVGIDKIVQLSQAILIGADSLNYTLNLNSAPTTTASIQPKGLTLTGTFSVADKEYDGTDTLTSADFTQLSLDGVIAAEDVTYDSIEAKFDTKTVGIAKLVHITSVVLSGNDKNNYSLSLVNTPSTTADINPKELTIAGIIEVEDKEYDGTTTANVTQVQANLNGIVSGDAVEIDQMSIEYDFATPAESVPVVIKSATLKGLDASNYTITVVGSPSATASIIPKKLSLIGSFTVSDKEYDGTKLATISSDSLLELNGIIGAESVQYDSLIAEFSTATVGTGKVVRLVNGLLTGADSANYTLNFTSSPVAEASITSKMVELVGSFSVSSKTYDGTITANVTNSSNLSIQGAINGDDLDFKDVKAEFQNKSVGSAKTVVIKGAVLTGTDSLNYKVSSSVTTTADITTREVGITGNFSVENKIYDGNVSAKLELNELSLTNSIVGDDIVLDSVEVEFSQETVGTNIRVDIEKAVLSGLDKQNYILSLTSSPTALATIEPKELTLTGVFEVENKDYDATTSATISSHSLQLVGIVTNETVTLDTIDATFSTKDAEENKIVNLSRALITGLHAPNYYVSLTALPTAIATIHQKEIEIVNVQAANKVYDSTDKATLISIGTLDGLIGSETLVLNQPSLILFKQTAVEDNIDVTASGYTLSDGANGGLASNYSLSSDEVTVQANITPAPLTIKAIDHTIVEFFEPYSGGNGVTYIGFVGVETEAVLEDTLKYSGSSQGAEKPGTYTITPYGLKSSNYTITFEDGTLTILPIPFGEDAKPIDYAEKISLSAEVSLAFSTDVKEGPNLADVKILIDGETEVSDVTAKLQNKRLVFSHPNFQNYSFYKVIVPEGAVLSTEDVPNAWFEWHFTTIRALPQVKSTIPLADVRAIELDTDIRVKFDQEITEVNFDLIRITDAANVRVNNVTITKIDSVTLDIAHPDFAHSTVYTVTIPANTVKNLDDIANAEYKWSFRTILTPPAVTTLSPTAAATKVSVDAAISVTLNQDISAVDLNTIRVYSAAGDTVQNLNIFLIGRSITIGHPPFENNTSYIVSIPAGTVKNTDNIGNELISWNFRTIKTQPVYSVLAPANGSGGVSIDTLIAVTFDQKISITNTTGVVIRDDANRAVSSVLVSLVDSTLQISHAPLTNNKTYTVTIPANFVKNEDQLGNQGLTWSFKTIRSKPIAKRLTPLNRSVDIVRDTPIKITFDQEIEMINANGISMKEQSGIVVDGLTAEMESDSTISISVPTLKYSTTYIVLIADGAVQNSDLIANNAISWSFTTVVEPPAKPVLTDPANDDSFVNQKPVFTWNASARAQTYHIQIGLSAVFDAIISEKTGITATTFTVQLQPNTAYSWRVKAENVGGTSDWSETFEFITKANTPTLVFPGPSSTLISIAPMLSWDGNSDLKNQIQVSTNSQFTSLIKDTLVQETAVLIKGLAAKKQYFWRVRVNDESGRSDWSAPRSFTTRPDPSETENKTVVQTIEFAKIVNNSQRIPVRSDYKLIGMPGSESIPLYEMFTDEYLTMWRAFEETGSEDNNDFNEYNPNDSSMAFSAGKGYWIISKSALSIRRGFHSVTVDANDCYPIPLNRGWNIIVNPYQTEVDWDLTQEINGIVAELYDFDAVFKTATSMKPFKGYYFDNQTNLNELLIPYSNSTQVGVVSGKMNLDLETIPNMKFVAKYADEQIDSVEFVFDDKSEDYVPKLEKVNLSKITNTQINDESIVLERTHPKLNFAKQGMVIGSSSQSENTLKYVRKRAILEYESYTLQIKAQTGEKIELSATSNLLPENVEMLLINALTRTFIRLGNDESIQIKVTEPLSTFDVYIGSSSYLDEIIESLLPEQFTLEQNYPNPFNPSTIIRYSLPNDAKVKLEVYDVLGRVVKTLINSNQKAGWYTVEFNGAQLASGVYLYRLQAGDFAKVQKMTLVK